MRLLVLMLIFVSTLSFADTKPQPTNTQPINVEYQQLQKLNAELSILAKEATSTTGSSLDVVRLQLLNKNKELRQTLTDLIDDKQADKKLLLKQVEQQIKFAAEAEKFLQTKVERDQKDLDKAKDTDKLVALKALTESRDFIILVLNDEWENYQWMERLGKPQPNSVKALKKNIEHRLDFMSASLTFGSQALELNDKQIKSATGEELKALQVTQILSQRQVSSDTKNLTDLVKLADGMGLDTAEYKRLLFEQTGNVTDDLLNSKVMWSIVTSWTTDLSSWLFENLPQMIFKVIIFIFIIFAFKTLKNIVRKMVTRAVSTKNLKMSMLMQEFFISMSGKIVFAIGILIALSQVGLNLAPILTGFGVAGIIVGFALQDTLSNFASGMMLLIYRPFDVGDLVEAGSITGKVSHMSLVNTTIKTFSNEIIIVPNSKIWGDIIKNVTHEKVRRIDMVFGIGYSDDIEKTERVLQEIVESHPSVLRSPEPNIKLHTLNSSSVDFIVRPWVKTDDYWDVYWDITREVKMRFDREGISIPFPQQDVHLHMVEKAIESKIA
ncbi:mechanosensitive ion channel family protein [Photobacterium iliopiscarium]|uniref:Small-conductance mechanosensitive channel n=1 Tax=Photobacterium iliopiscarium TaxID=56192 RepID=A0A2T3MEK9_9GAMM|nr:mechanosensitive ion channel family protein [Photobacterium iliopiscarium]PST94098.1 mechanosensitive ion channel protein MscS [Photobacterium iliopiscarium]PST98039.1 mechanosensitive ion channel protein MscS [Photobacterium iliopiscarium]PSV79917.1 mechanosensitive ion channel protein MscS [Photobacterium iliopiscarium]PSV92132.1 mechanosensitive ion channel protein MscS [Photobacterium iliopiscarium]